MKKLVFPFVIFLVVMAVSAQNFSSVLYVSAKTVDVKASSSFFSRVLGTLNKGDVVTLVQPHGKWIIVLNSSGLQGWAAADAFSTRRIVNRETSISSTEFAMAGKGFTSDLEQFFRSSEDADYTEVDKMEEFSIAPDELRAFLTEGRLGMGE